MHVSIVSSKFLSCLEELINKELLALNNREIVDVKIGSNDNGYYAMILYR